MSISRRNFIKNVGLGLTGLGLGTKRMAYSYPKGDGNSEKLLVKNPDHPEAATYDRLPLSWYKKTVKRLKEKAALVIIRATICW